MSKLVIRFGIVAILIAVLLVAFSGSIFAAGGNADNGNQGDECPYGDCTCGDCEPKANSYEWSDTFEPSGPHGPYKYQHGKTTI